jgi:hypothetical protein
VLRKTFGSKRDELKVGWRKFHNLYTSSDFVRMMKTRRMRLPGHVACMGEKRST